jgi:hypothetical protein
MIMKWGVFANNADSSFQSLLFLMTKRAYALQFLIKSFEKIPKSMISPMIQIVTHLERESLLGAFSPQPYNKVWDLYKI